METGNDQRQQLIHRARTRGNGDAPDVVLQLWQPLASQLIPLIGEGGFHALFARSLYLTRATFPWLAPGDTLRAADAWFVNLRICLEAQSAIEANKASHMLLLTFTDILASLIGEALTISILRSVWGDDAPESDIAGKELSHD